MAEPNKESVSVKMKCLFQMTGLVKITIDLDGNYQTTFLTEEKEAVHYRHNNTEYTLKANSELMHEFTKLQHQSCVCHNYA